MKCRVVYKPDKSVAIIKHSPKSKLSEEEAFNKAMKHHGFEALPHDDIDSSELPQSREDRYAWEGEKGKKITVNQAKVKEKKDKEERTRLISGEKDKLAEQSLVDKGVING